MMNKGLDALKELYGAIRCENSHNLEACSVLRETIEKELKEKEKLQKLLDHERELNNHLITHELKALETIKKVTSMSLFETNKDNPLGETHYYINISNVCAYRISQEEYDLLKEVLVCH